MAPFDGMVLLLLGIGYLLHAEPSLGHRDIGIIADDVRSRKRDDGYVPIVRNLYDERSGIEIRSDRSKRHTSFSNDLPQNMTAAAGQSAVLSCRVENLGNKTVSWMRMKDLRILTSMEATYTTDKRFTIVGKPNWDLRIDSVQPEDTGIYECQVNTEPKIHRAVSLKVLDVQAKILGSEEVYVKKGSKISLTCTVDMQDVPPSNVTWYHAGSVIDFDSPRGGVSLETEKGKSFTKSMLVITRALLNDSGNYTCFSNKAAPASVVVHVLNGEHPAAMQHGGTGSVNRRILLFLAIVLPIVLFRCFVTRDLRCKLPGKQIKEDYTLNEIPCNVTSHVIALHYFFFILSKRKTLSKLSIVPDGSRMIFQRRGTRFKIPLYQNTYRLEPFNFFHVETVDQIVHAVLEKKLSSVLMYHPDYASKLSMETANDVLKAISKRDYDRCKVVVQVTIVQRMRQSVHTAFQCLWDTERDNYSYHVFENSHIYAWCCVFGLYYE